MSSPPFSAKRQPRRKKGTVSQSYTKVQEGHCGNEHDLLLSSMCQCTLVYGMISSNPFNLRVMSVRCAIYSTSAPCLTSTPFYLSLSGPDRKLTPRTSIGDIEMIAIPLRRELRARLSRDEVAKGRLSSFELSRPVAGIDELRDLRCVSGLPVVLSQSEECKGGDQDRNQIRGASTYRHGRCCCWCGAGYGWEDWSSQV